MGISRGSGSHTRAGSTLDQKDRITVFRNEEERTEVMQQLSVKQGQF
jgi:hypothetical protein